MEITAPKVLEFRIPADTRYLSMVRRGIRCLAESVGFPREDVADVEVAVSEAITNSVKHGGPDCCAAGVLVKCETCGDRLVVEIEDRSPVKSLPVAASCTAIEEGGRGMTVMRALMDEYENCFTDSGLRVRMTKQKAR